MVAKKFTLQERIFWIARLLLSIAWSRIAMRRIKDHIYSHHPRTLEICACLSLKKSTSSILTAATLEGFWSTLVRGVKKFKRLVVVTLSSSRNTHFCTVSCTYKFVFCHYLQRFHENFVSANFDHVSLTRANLSGDFCPTLYVQVYIPLCIRTHDTGHSFQPIFIKFTRFVRVRTWVNPTVFGYNRPSRTTDIRENVSPKQVFPVSLSQYRFLLLFY